MNTTIRVSVAMWALVAWPSVVDAEQPEGEREEVNAGMAVGAEASDPWGFLAVLNAHRAAARLPPVVVDANLSAWASQNNLAQCRRGLGHHVNPNCFQNCGWNYASAWDVAVGWMNSPGHRSNMLSPVITRVGIAYGPGPYWTMNAR
jgi:uncharacterized protein YkwD